MSKELCFLLEGKCLYLEQVLVSYLKVPIFFLCKSEDEWFLALCTDFEECNYVIVQLTVEDTYKLLHGSISMREIILKQEMFWEVISADEIENDLIRLAEISELNEELLPEDGACYVPLTEDTKKFVKMFDADYINPDYFDIFVNGSETCDTIVIKNELESIHRDEFYINFNSSGIDVLWKNEFNDIEIPCSNGNHNIFALAA